VVDETAAEHWRSLLAGDDPGIHRIRRAYRNWPSPPRCKMCLAPFAGVGGFLLRPWFGRWDRNPALCKACMRTLFDHGPGGAEVEISFLFADIRGSTGLAERIGATAFAGVLRAFYVLATEAIQGTDGIVDKFVGDEAIGLFIPGMSGPDHPARAVAAGRELLARATADDASADRPIPVGAAVHTGLAFVGSVGPTGDPTDFTALGDPVNSTARLASLAAAGELLVSSDAVERAGLDVSGLERRSVEVRGREAPIDVFALVAATASRDDAQTLP
jgi:adenylate cyclase